MAPKSPEWMEELKGKMVDLVHWAEGGPEEEASGRNLRAIAALAWVNRYMASNFEVSSAPSDLVFGATAALWQHALFVHRDECTRKRSCPCKPDTPDLSAAFIAERYLGRVEATTGKSLVEVAAAWHVEQTNDTATFEGRLFEFGHALVRRAVWNGRGGDDGMTEPPFVSLHVGTSIIEVPPILDEQVWDVAFMAQQECNPEEKLAAPLGEGEDAKVYVIQLPSHKRKPRRRR